LTDFSNKIKKLTLPTWIFWTSETEDLDREKVLFNDLPNGKTFFLKNSEEHDRIPVGSRHSWVFEEIDKCIEVFERFCDYLYENRIV